MAHKKGVGSTKNGRDSQQHSVWAPSVQTVSSFWPATSWFVSVAPTSCRVRTLARAAMTPCLLWLTALSVLSAWARAARSAA